MKIINMTKQKNFARLFCAAAVFFIIGLAKPQVVNATTSGNFDYEINSKGTITITKYIGYTANVTIPSSIGGRTVTDIGTEAFYYTNVVNVTLPSTITTIGNSAFKNSSLEK